MPEATTDLRDPSFLIRADNAALAAWGEAVRHVVDDPVEKRFLVSAVRHPYLRHLLEMAINNSVTAAGARKLLALGYVRVVQFYARADWWDMHPVSALEFTPLGLTQLEKIEGAYGDRKWFISFQEAICEYACRDTGDGFCLSRAHLENAIACEDEEVLRGTVSPDDFRYEFIGKLPALSIFTEADRLETERFWSPRCLNRRSAKIFRSGYDISEPIFRPSDCEEMSDPDDIFEDDDDSVSGAQFDCVLEQVFKGAKR